MRSLRECKNFDDVCEMENDNFVLGDSRDWSFSFDGTDIGIAQKGGQSIGVPKAIFDQMIEAYNKQQIVSGSDKPKSA